MADKLNIDATNPDAITLASTSLEAFVLQQPCRSSKPKDQSQPKEQTDNVGTYARLR